MSKNDNIVYSPLVMSNDINYRVCTVEAQPPNPPKGGLVRYIYRDLI